MANEVAWKTAIDLVLKKSPKPLHYKEIADLIISEGLRKNIGATPADTVSAQLSVSIKNEGEDSPFRRVSRGVYAHRERVSVNPPADIAGSEEEDETHEDQYDIITSFGVFWRRDAVDWRSTPQILGMQTLGATPVDFNQQLGVYLLYDGREVIYVGRSADRPLGKRLYEHTFDRLSTRWDRFSWFGMLPVSDSGNLGSLPTTQNSAKLISAFEAILIEALEPRQNRKRGDDLSAVEYIQKEDPEIAKKRMRASLEAVMEKM